MKQQTIRFMAAVPECSAERIGAILSAIGMEPEILVQSGEEAIAAAGEGHVLLLTTYQLSDMTGGELAKRLGENADVLMIVPADYEESEADGGALLLYNPLSQEALHQALRATMHMQSKLLEQKAKAQKAERQLSERKIIDRAKGRLMDEKKMSEKEAHYLIQKTSMDQGRRIVDVAREILDAETLAGEEE